jgi:hypothetical protein
MGRRGVTTFLKVTGLACLPSRLNGFYQLSPILIAIVFY